MRKKYERVNSVFNLLGSVLQFLGYILLLPIILVGVYWGLNADGWVTVAAFALPALASFCIGYVFRRLFKPAPLDMAGSMLFCALSWVFVSLLGALPFVIGIDSGYLNAFFEAMSGFTTTGITVYSGLDSMPRSVLFWRSLTQWLGGIGILSFFLMITFRGGGAHHIYGAESHKIASRRPTPGLFHTVRILWAIYGLFTVMAMVVLTLEKMPVFDAVCHSLTALSTGGFSPHDSSIEYYRLSGHANYRLIEYTVAFIMMLGGINFLVHYRVLTRDIKALWDNLEVRYWWGLVGGFTLIVMFDHLSRTDVLVNIFRQPSMADLGEVESSFRYSVFQVISLMTTTGFGTKDIGASFFPALTKQLFLVMMVIGGCTGSTGGGFKVLRIAILKRALSRELFKTRVAGKASTGLIIDKKIVPEDEVLRVAGLFFGWMALLVLGGVVTALFSNHSGWESISGMFSALGNIGPCYISVADMIKIHPAVKLTYIFGMLAGRLELLPVLMLFSRRAWR